VMLRAKLPLLALAQYIRLGARNKIIYGRLVASTTLPLAPPCLSGRLRGDQARQRQRMWIHGLLSGEPADED
jgi:hypothetical protein